MLRVHSENTIGSSMRSGSGVVWLHQGVGDEQRFLEEFKDRLMPWFMQN